MLRKILERNSDESESDDSDSDASNLDDIGIDQKQQLFSCVIVRLGQDYLGLCELIGGRNSYFKRIFQV